MNEYTYLCVFALILMVLGTSEWVALSNGSPKLSQGCDCTEQSQREVTELQNRPNLRRY